MTQLNANKKIKSRIFIKGTLSLDSPLMLGSGENDMSDMDLMRDWKGDPFLPGTSLAGTARQYLNDVINLDKNTEETYKKAFNYIFGSGDENSVMSPVIFYDVFPVDAKSQKILEKIVIRDSVKICGIRKTAVDKSKFNYEVLEPGADFNFKMEVVLREIEESDRIIQMVFLYIKALKEGLIRCGAKTRRGFGKIRLKDIYVLSLNMTKKDEAERWLTFNWENHEESWKAWDDSPLVKKYSFSKANSSVNTLYHISADFSIPHSIIIRNYSSDPSLPDSVHQKCGNDSIIPGTSWAGVLRHTILNIGNQLKQSEKFDENKFEKMVKNLFGYVKGKSNFASRIIVEESSIDGGKILRYTRNKVDRFTGGVVESALFDNAAHFGGEVRLNIYIKPNPAKQNSKHEPVKQEADIYAEIGLILPALKDMGFGIAPIGGENNIGRGILELKTDGIKLNNNKLDDKYEKKCLKALWNELQKEAAE